MTVVRLDTAGPPRDRDLVRAKYADWRVTPYEWAPAPVPQ